eukprot:1655597-Amphidinium_carterae.1
MYRPFLDPAPMSGTYCAARALAGPGRAAEALALAFKFGTSYLWCVEPLEKFAGETKCHEADDLPENLET